VKISRTRIVYFGIACAVATLFVASGIAKAIWYNGWIAADPVLAKGRVMTLDCNDNHGFVDYSFEIDGATYHARSAYLNNIPCQAVKIGQPVAVYYEKGAPENNYGVYPPETPGNPARAAFLYNLAAFAVFTFLVPLIYIWRWFKLGFW
jgi:hypothetical protein